jgi:hypothetical protein
MSAETIIEIRPHRGGWQAFEAPGVEPYWLGEDSQDCAIRYAEGRTAMRKGEIRFMNSAGEIERAIAFDNKAQRF